jgi:hypothetical protein
MALLVGLAAMVLGALSQAIVLYGAFEDMRGRPVNLLESLRFGLRRAFPVLGVAVLVPILAGLAALMLIFPGAIVLTTLLVAMPACVAEKLGPLQSMRRSAQLTKGHRWAIFGIWIATTLAWGIVQSVLDKTPTRLRSSSTEIAVLQIDQAEERADEPRVCSL